MYHKYKVNLTGNQAKKLSSAMGKSMPISIRFSNAQIGHGTDLLFTQTQINALERAKMAGKGKVIKFSLAAIRAMRKDGGFLPALAALVPLGIAVLSGVLSTASAYGTQKGIQAIEKAAAKKKQKQGGQMGRLRQTGGADGGKLYQLGTAKRGGCGSCGGCRACGDNMPMANYESMSSEDGGSLYQLGTGNGGALYQLGVKGGKLFPLGVKDTRRR